MNEIYQTLIEIHSYFQAFLGNHSEFSKIFFWQNYNISTIILSFFLILPITYYHLQETSLPEEGNKTQKKYLEKTAYTLTYLIVISIGSISATFLTFLGRDIGIVNIYRYDYLQYLIALTIVTNYVYLKVKNSQKNQEKSFLIPLLLSTLFSLSVATSFHLLALTTLIPTASLTTIKISFITHFIALFLILFPAFFFAGNFKKTHHQNLLISSLIGTFILWIAHHSFFEIFTASLNNIEIGSSSLSYNERFDFAWRLIIANIVIFATFFLWKYSKREIPTIYEEEPSLVKKYLPLILFVLIGISISYYVSKKSSDSLYSEMKEQENIKIRSFKKALEDKLKKHNIYIHSVQAFFKSSNHVGEDEFFTFFDSIETESYRIPQKITYSSIVESKNFDVLIKDFKKDSSSFNESVFKEKYQRKNYSTPVIYTKTTLTHEDENSTEKYINLLNKDTIKRSVYKAIKEQKTTLTYSHQAHQLSFITYVETTSKDTLAQKGVVVITLDLNDLLYITKQSNTLFSSLKINADHQEGRTQHSFTFLGEKIPFYIQNTPPLLSEKNKQFYLALLTGLTLVILFTFYILTIIQQRDRDRKFQEKITSQKLLFTTILENMPLGIFVKDVKNDYRYTIINKYAESFLNRPISEILNKSDYEIYNQRHGALIRAQDEEIMRSKCVNYREEETFSLNDEISEETFTVRSIKVPIYDVNGKPEILLNIYEDVTEKIKIRNDLIDAKDQAEKSNAIKGNFLASMSHELRTPLNSIIGLSKNLLEDKTLTHEQKEMTDTVVKASSSLLNVVNDILDLSKVESGKVILDKNIFDLKKDIHSIIRQLTPLAKDKGLFFNTQLNDLNENECFYADSHRLSRCIVNVIGNAIKYTESGGVTITTQLEDSPKDPHFKVLTIDVKDTGIGIDPDKIDSIFDSFTQADASIERKYGGTGLGLNITQKILELMDGNIYVESHPGLGSTFTIRLPLQRVKESHKNQGTITPEDIHQLPDFSDYRILVAEDQEFNNILMKVLFKKYKIDEYEICLNGVKVLDALAKDKQGYDLILMDCHMPEMDGYKTSKAIRENNILSRSGAPIPIVALTADITSGIKEKCLTSGMNDYLSKPIDETLFTKKLKKHLKKPQEESN